MAVLLVRPVTDAVVNPLAPLPHEVGDIFEVRPDGCSIGRRECGWAIDLSDSNGYGKWPIWFVHIPGLCASRTDLSHSQELWDVPEWIGGTALHRERTRYAPTTAWLRGCWIDVDELEYRHRLGLEQTGHCHLTIAEASAVIHSMTDAVSTNLEDH